MIVALPPGIQAFVNELIQSGQYETPEAVIQAGLVALRQHESFGDFIPGELNELIAEVEKSLEESGFLDAEEALRARLTAAAKRRGRKRRPARVRSAPLRTCPPPRRASGTRNEARVGSRWRRCRQVAAPL